jgi:hypothetical protein
MSKHEKVNSDKNDGRNVSFKSLILISLAVTIIQVVVGYLVYLLLPNWNDRASFGDMFGAVSTLFSGLAFAGVIYAIFLQRRELELQRYELEMTREELRRTAEAQEKSEAALNEQAKAMMLTAKISSINLIPAIYPNVGMQGSKVFIEISNIGNTSAFDIDVLNVGIYNAEKIEVEEFISKYVKKETELVSRIETSEDDFYGVYDHICYAVIPSRRKVKAIFDFPIPPFGIYILLQFRDIQGNNYHQLSNVWYRGERSYQVTNIEPKTPDVASRVDFNANLVLETDDNSPLPNYMEEFVQHWGASIPSGYTISGFPEVEARGEWHDI